MNHFKTNKLKKKTIKTKEDLENREDVKVVHIPITVMVPDDDVKVTDIPVKDGEILESEKVVTEKKAKEATTLFTPLQLQEALLFAVDQLERAMMKFMVMGETAKQLHDYETPSLELDFIHLGARKSEVTKYALDTLDVMLKKENEYQMGSKDQIYFVSLRDRIPIVVELVDTEIDVFKNPEPRFYYTTELWMPNPFEKYWEEVYKG